MTSLQSCLNVQSASQEFEDKLASLSIDKCPYSELDKTKINKALDLRFGKDIYGRKIRPIVADFLGYQSYDNVSSNYTVFIEKCSSLIKASNKEKAVDTKAALILQTIYDEKGVFASCTFLSQLVQLAKSHYVVFRLIGLEGETIGKTINKVSKELNGRPIVTLIVRAHGDKNGIGLGNKNFYTASDVRSEDFSPLNSRASIIINSCFAGCNLAKKIAKIQSRVIFACVDEDTDTLLTPCCSEHGYGMVSFNQFQDQIAKIFTSDEDDVIEVTPCCATRERIEKIKQKILCDRFFAAKSGDSVAQYTLGICYYLGRGLPKSYEKAVKWYLKSALQGDVDAKFSLGVIYYLGHGVEKSLDNAIEWTRQAAEEGHIKAKQNLGIFVNEMCASVI